MRLTYCRNAARPGGSIAAISCQNEEVRLRSFASALAGASGPDTIPAFLSIDVEPHGFQLSRPDMSDWTGYDAMIDFAEELRAGLARRAGTSPRFGWYFRTDPQIAEVYGRPDHILAAHPDRIAALRACGDYLGVHSHPVRWCRDRQEWVHDFADGAWLARCTEAALDGFAQWNGAPATRFRAGAGFLSNEIVDALERCGVRAELALEPVAGWWLNATHVGTDVDRSPFRGAYADVRTAPRVAFHPARHDFRVAARRGERRLALIPLTTYVEPAEPTRWWRRLRGGRDAAPAEARMPYLNQEWPSAQSYWDLVDRQLRSMPRPYLSLGIRTDLPGSTSLVRTQRMLAALPRHPMAERLRFVDPLEVVEQLV